MGALVAWIYGAIGNYGVTIVALTVVIRVILLPLGIRQIRSMQAMQIIQPEIKRLQTKYKGDRQKLNEEMMKLYQEHKVNPLSSCLPLLAQMPVFIIMFRVLHGLTSTVTCTGEAVAKNLLACTPANAGKQVFVPKYLDTTTKLYQSLVGKNTMTSWGLDLSKRPFGMMSEGFGKGLLYMLLVLVLAGQLGRCFRLAGRVATA